MKSNGKLILKILAVLIVFSVIIISVIAVSHSSWNRKTITKGNNTGNNNQTSTTPNITTPPDTIPPNPQKDYTMLVYMVGSDLESKHGCGTADIREMQNALQNTDGLSEKLNIVIQLGGAKETAVSWSEIPAFKSVSGGIEVESDSVSVLNTSSLNMGNSASLSNFINYGISAYPAEDYILVLWNHGGGPNGGYGIDENFNDTLYMDELKTAFENSEITEKFKIIGFDACLMADLEVASIVDDYGEYMVAAQAPEPGSGWNYGWLSILAEEKSTEEIGKHIVDTFKSSKYSNRPEYTLSVLDLSKIDTVVSELSEVCSETDFGALYRAIKKNRTLNSKVFSKDLIDLYSIVRQGSAFKDLRTSIENAVVYSQPDGLNINGISIYLPGVTSKRTEDERRETVSAYQKIPFEDSWKRFVTNHYNELCDENLEYNPENSANTIDFKNGILRAELDLNSENLMSAYTAVVAEKDGFDVLMGTLDNTFEIDDGDDSTFVLGADWAESCGGNWLELNGQFVSAIAKETYTDDSYIAEIPVLINGEQNFLEVCVTPNGENFVVDFIGYQPVNPLSTNGNIGSRYISEFQKGDVITPLFVKMDADTTDLTNTDIYVKGTDITLNSTADLNFGFSYLPNPILGFAIEDFSCDITFTEFILV
jgi:hypothetical protein